jgi:hypothetical protein
MGHHMMSSSDECCDSGWSGTFSIPMPMAMFGVLVGFMFGATVGMLMGRKSGMSHGRMGGHGWRHRGMHHHHASGMPACGCGEWKAAADEQPLEVID